MPKDDLKTIRVGAPFTGLNESADPRLLEPGELPDLSNVVIRDGRICPRPGYEELYQDSIGLALRVHATDMTGAINNITYASSAGYVYLASSGADFYRVAISTNTKTSYSVAGTVGQAAAVADATRIFYTNLTDEKTVEGDATFSAPANQYTTQTGLDGGIAIDATNSRVFYYRAGAGIYRGNYTPGTTAEHISVANVGANDDVYGMVVDETNSKLYWINPTDNSVRRASSTSANTGVEAWITSGFTGTLLFITIDTSASPRVIYFATTDNIYYCAVNASTPTRLIGFAENIAGIAYDATNDRMFVAQLHGGGSTYRLVSFNVNISSIYPVVTECYRRSLLGVSASGGEYAKDLWWVQCVDTSASKTIMTLFRPATGDVTELNAGYKFGVGTDPTIWVSLDHDTDSAENTPYSSSSARAKFAWTGRGINEAKGGWIVTQKGSGARVLNYVLTDTIYTVTHADDGGSDTGTWQFVFLGKRSTGGLLADGSSDAAAVRADLLTLPGINGVHVTKSGSVWTIRIHGVWSGQNTPALTTNRTAGSNFTVTAAVVQTGGLDTAASGYVGPIVYCRPAGMPRVNTGIGGAVAGLRDVTVDNGGTGLAGGAGIYSFKITPYSSRFDLEGPPSDEFGDDDLSYALFEIAAGSPNAATFTLNTIPSTIYYSSTSPFRHIDKYRVYARRWGTAQSGGVITNATGAWDDWYLIYEWDIGQASSSATFVWDGDPTDKTTVKVPVVNEYPPDNAAIVELHDDRAWYNSGDNLIWASELPKRGGVADGELGHEYVSNELFNQINRQVKNDFPVTALKSHAGRLFLGTPERMIAIDTSLLTSQGTVFVDPMEGTSGVANQWTVCETSPLPDMPGYLLWLSPYGHIYAFNGATSQRLSLNLGTSVDDMAKKFWVDDTYFESALATLHYSSMVVDPVEQRIILSTVDKNGTRYNLCYSVADKAWSKWTIGGYSLENGRLWTGTDKGKDIIVVGLAGGKLWKLMDGYADAVTAADADGSSFAWYATTKKMSPTSGFYKTKWGKLAAMFNSRNFSATNASMTLTPIIGKGALTVRSETSSQKDLACVSVGSRSHWVQLKISGTHTHLMDHAEFSAVVAEYDPNVTGDLADTDNDPSS